MLKLTTPRAGAAPQLTAGILFCSLERSNFKPLYGGSLVHFGFTGAYFAAGGDLRIRFGAKRKYRFMH
jgi:hypothetical protein